jgi:hypothetical protein
MKALKGLVDGSRTGHREQRVHTPEPVIRVLRSLWPEGIAFDPCGSPDSIVGAADQAYPEIGRDGLAEPWPERTFFNPPYDNLAPWLARYREAWEIVGLVPVRTHRVWFRAALAASSAVVWLDPLKFLGHGAAFPAPLCLLYRGAAPAVLRRFVGLHKLAKGDCHTEIRG